MLNSILNSLEKIAIKSKDTLIYITQYLRQLTKMGEMYKYLNRYIIGFEDKYYAAYSGIGNISEAMQIVNGEHLAKTEEEKSEEKPWGEDELQTLYTSGTVFHAFLGEKLPDWKAAASLVRTIASNYKLPYYTLSPTYSICKEHGYLAGEVKVCPHCGAKTEVPYHRLLSSGAELE